MLYILSTIQNSLISFDSTKNCLDFASFLGRPNRLITMFVSRQKNHIQPCAAVMKRMQTGGTLHLRFWEM